MKKNTSAQGGSALGGKKHLLSFILLSVLFMAQIVVAQAVLADDLWDTVKDGGLGTIGQEAYGTGGDEPQQNVQEIMARVIAVSLGLLGIIFTSLIVLAGYKWMIASGNEDKISEAKDQLKAGIIGLLIILAAYAIAHLVLNKIIFATTGAKPVWQ
ncbi:MAG: hypothetical protein U9R14_03625 [Patescibacteria group bacterium]|nr:hypothetical protein [Patescibacteria group bacterium]